MVRDLMMPQLAMAMSEGTVIEWKAEEGALLEREAPLLTVETEKVLVDIASPYEGYLHIDEAAGATVPTERRIARFADTWDEYLALAGPPPDEHGAPETAAPSPSAAGYGLPEPAGPRHVAASGLARKLAREHHVALDGLTGTGPRGRVVRRDVLGALDDRAAAPTPVPSATGPGSGAVRRIPLSGMRKVIAERLVRATTVAAPTHAFFEVDVTKLLAVRRTFLAREAELGTRISLTTLYVKALATALASVPVCNATLDDDELSVWEDVHVGVAVALPGDHDIDSKLVVPVLRNADSKSVRTLDAQLKDLTARARGGQLGAEDLRGATVTLSSTAGFYPDGWMVSAPILNLPQVVNFQPGTVIRKPVVHEDAVVARDMLPCALTFDHRAFDGQVTGRLAKRIGDLLSNPEMMLL